MKMIKPTANFKYEKEFERYLKTISRRLKQLRLARKLTVTKVAERLKLPPSKILEIEDGKHDFQVYLIIALCKLYNTQVEEVVNFLSPGKTIGSK